MGRGCPFIEIEAGDQVIGMVDSDAGSPQLRSLSRASSKNRKKGKRGSGGDSFDPNVAGLDRLGPVGRSAGKAASGDEAVGDG